MNRIKSLVIAVLVTLTLSSNAFAGNIYGVTGNIYGVSGNIYGVTRDGNIYGVVSNSVMSVITMVY